MEHMGTGNVCRGAGTRVPVPMCVNPSREQTFPPAKSHHFPRYHFLCSSPLMGTGTRVLASQHTLPVPTRFVPMCAIHLRNKTSQRLKRHNSPALIPSLSAAHGDRHACVGFATHVASPHVLRVPHTTKRWRRMSRSSSSDSESDSGSG